jgi:peptidoglycan L-alanyl-D-glutamate endopeptidase CwlK
MVFNLNFFVTSAQNCHNYETICKDLSSLIVRLPYERNMLLKKRIGSLLFIFCLIIIGFLYIQINKKQSPAITELNPVVTKQMNELIRQSAEKGLVVVVTDGFRSLGDQDKLYAKGRTASGSIVTNAKGGQSYHNFGLAIDFALKTPSGKIIWDRQYDGNKNGKSDWTEVVDIAKRLGFQWGGDWEQFQDYPHLQMDFGLSLAQLRNGERPSETSVTADSK